MAFLDSIWLCITRGIALFFILVAVLYAESKVEAFFTYETGFLHAPECLPCEYPSARIIQDQIDAGIHEIDCAGKTYLQDGEFTLTNQTHLSHVTLVGR
jgi:hypothetical protein